MANEFIARNGLIAQNNSVVTGSLIVTQGITGSLFGTASYADAARTVEITEVDSAPVTFNVTFVGGTGGNNSLVIDTTALTYTPSTSTFSTPIIEATSITGSLFGTASYASNGGVTQLLAGPNISLSPTTGLGQVTISSTGGGGFNTATGSYGSFYDTTT